MIYTVDTTNNQVVMTSHGHNQYTNEHWIDVEYDEAVFDDWQTGGGDLYYKPEDGSIYIVR